MRATAGQCGMDMANCMADTMQDVTGPFGEWGCYYQG
jgi:hypothetical protein